MADAWTRYVDNAIAHERELREKDAVALRLQAVEYERRLDQLNHAHARATEALNTFVSREKFEAFAKNYDDSIARMRTQLDEQRGASTRTMALVSVALTILSLFLRFYPLR